jgi:hypothetical protein
MTNRFPVKFEEEVLIKHGWHWSNENMFCYMRAGCIAEAYTLAGIAIEAILKKMVKNLIEEQKEKEPEDMDLATGDGIEIGYDLFRGFTMYSSNNAEDEDFCECIFKAVNEIWGEQE